MIKYLITGANGQLAREFLTYFKIIGVDFLALTKQDMDVSKLEDVMRVITEVKPDIIINCSAYNQVDKAESEGALESLMVNAVGPLNLALAAKQVKAFFVHYSTDYVFDGKKESLYTEEDIPNPLNFYGKTKLLGEELIKNTHENCLIFRTSWVYGQGRQNFLYKLQQWIEKQNYLRIACDEFSVPTYTKTIVEVTLRAVKEGLTGLYHLTSSGYASRYEWAKEFLELKGIKKFIYPAYREEFNLPAKRPKWSAMSNEKIVKALNIEIKYWKEYLKEFVYNNNGD